MPGTVAVALLLESETVKPPGPAVPFSVTVPEEGFPPVTLVGLTLTERRVEGVTVRFAVCETPFRLAVITAEV